METMAFTAVSPEQAQARLAQGAIEIIDVREYHEWVGGHLTGSRLIPLADFRANPKAQLPPEGVAVLFVCAAGVRASLAPYNTQEDIEALVAALNRLQVGYSGLGRAAR